MSVHKEAKRITTQVLHEMKQNGEKISMLTAYDYTLAKIIDGGGIDIILVGDSASNVMAGHETTLPITLNEMIYHAASVVRAVNRCLVVVDMPFGSYQGNSLEALSSAIRIMKESGGHSVKLEGGSEIIESVERILTAGIPVMGHLGLTPQSIYKFGTYTVRAKEEEEAEKLISGGSVSSEVIENVVSVFKRSGSEERIDTIVLGCTHFPFLISALSKALPNVLWIDSGEAIAKRVKDLLSAVKSGEGVMEGAQQHQIYFSQSRPDERVFSKILSEIGIDDYQIKDFKPC